MTPDHLRRLSELVERATSGEWVSRIEPQRYPECDDADYPATISANGQHIAFLPERYDSNLNQVNDIDAALIVAAVNFVRSDLPQLLARITALEAALEPFARIAAAVEDSPHRDGEVVHRQLFNRDGGFERIELTKEHFRRAAQALSERSCTCHPDDRPDGPCPQKFAARECRAQSALQSGSEVGGE